MTDKAKPDAVPPDETPAQMALRKIASNPRFVVAQPSGTGFVIPGTAYTATVPAEPTFFYFDPDRPSVPAPVPMGPYREATEQLIANCMADHPGLTREETIEYLWEAGGM
jgi:hypothetical protein